MICHAYAVADIFLNTGGPDLVNPRAYDIRTLATELPTQIEPPDIAMLVSANGA